MNGGRGLILHRLGGGVLLLVCFGFFSAIVAQLFSIADWLNANDFSALWTYAVVARQSGAAVLYDYPTLHAAQLALGMHADLIVPFAYPPTFIALLLAIGTAACALPPSRRGCP